MSSGSGFPVIDLSTGDASEQIAAACAALGFFAVVGHGVPEPLLDGALDEARRFFSLTLEAKMAVAFPEPGYPYGYSPYRYETLASSLGDSLGDDVPPDLKESFSVGPDCLGRTSHALTDPDEKWIRSPSLWPAALPELRRTWEATFRAMAELSARLLGLMAVGLQLPGTYFDPLIDNHTSAMRALHYPPLAADAEDGALRAGAHTDYGTLTILATDGEPGLEVLDPVVGWRRVPHIPGALIVNLGDSIAQWTNDRWRSTMHRVALPEDPSTARYSLPFFHMANWDAIVECLPGCLAPGEEPRHPPVKAGPWLMNKFKATGA